MIMSRLVIAALATALLAAPFAAEANKSRHVTHHIATVRAPTYAASGVSAVRPTTQPTTFGTSGRPIGTVTAPSVGSYYWPSVGVTNAVPTWSNTGPGARR